MHRDATLSHVTNTKPGEFGTEFWIKIVGFGVRAANWTADKDISRDNGLYLFLLQPGVASLK
jgi:hypothetical protein